MNQPLILLVDDVDFFLEVEKGFLRQTPAEILTAKNGRDALELARRYRPDLIFMDVNMPVMDGLACCRALKRDPGLAGIPVVMAFAPSRDVDEAACRAAGCDGVLQKPLDRRAFLELGRRFLFSVDRREPRIPCQMTVDFRVGDHQGQGMGLDISEHGLYIGCRDEVAERDRIRLSFFLPSVSSRRIDLEGRVAWINQGFPRPKMNLPQGFGVEFRALGREDAAIIRDYIEKVAPAEAGCDG